MNRRLPIIVAVAAAVVAILVLLLLVMPKRSQVSAANDKLDAAVTEETALRAQLQQLSDLKAHAQETRHQLDKIATEIPPTEDEPGLIRLLQLATDKAEVNMTTQSIGTPTATGDFSTITTALSVEGNFFQCDAFLFQLENLPRIMKVTAVAVGPAEYPLLTMTLSAETYTTDTLAGPGNPPGNQPAAASVPSAISATPSPTP